jgi:hypothetical protein
MVEPPDFIVDTILLAMETGSRTEDEAVKECGELAQHNLLNWQHLRQKNEPLYQKVMDWCRTHPPRL